MLLPPEHDPDSLVKAAGPEGYEREIGKAPALTEFLKSLILEGRDLVYAEERAKLAADAKPLILSMKNAPVLRLALVRDVAALARVPLEDLQAQWGIAPGERAGAMPPDPGFASAPSFRRSEGLRFRGLGLRLGWTVRRLAAPARSRAQNRRAGRARPDAAVLSRVPRASE